MNRELLKSVVEGLIFSGPEPLNAEAIAGVVDEGSVDLVQAVIDELENEYEQRSRGFFLAKVAGGYQFRTMPNLASWILAMKSMKPSRLSRAALETLSIIAYSQPITRSSIEQIRGVESAGTIRNLLERDLIAVVGKKDIPGRPLLYGTSRRFLDVFGLPDLASLPPLPDVEAIDGEAG